MTSKFHTDYQIQKPCLNTDEAPWTPSLGLTSFPLPEGPVGTSLLGHLPGAPKEAGRVEEKAAIIQMVGVFKLVTYICKRRQSMWGETLAVIWK